MLMLLACYCNKMYIGDYILIYLSPKLMFQVYIIHILDHKYL